MKEKISANHPVSSQGKQYHLETGPGDLAEHCLLVGSPERAKMIAEKFFNKAKEVGNHRGLWSFTGMAYGMPMSVVTTGMGSASVAIVLPEVIRSGGRKLIRVGSCGVLWPHPKVGESVICAGAVRSDGASENWAPIEYPAVADYRVVSALVSAARQLDLPHYVGIGATTTCFNEGQARPDDTGYIPPRLQARHDELVRRGVLFYSMEEATIFTWASTHHNPYTDDNHFGYMAGAIDAIYAQRATGDFEVRGDEEAIRIAILAMTEL